MSEAANETVTEATTKPKRAAKKAAKKAAPKAKAAKKAPAKKAAPKADRAAGGVDVAALRKALKAKGVEFESRAGVTVLVELAEKNGVEVPKKPSGNIIGAQYRERYGKAQNNGDEYAAAFDKACKVDVPTGKDGKGKPKRVLDEKLLKEVAAANNVKWADIAGSNLGQKRMNLGNILRGMNRNGEKIVIGTKSFKGVKEGKGAAL